MTPGIWIWFKSSPQRWEREPRFFPGMTVEQLLALRRRVKQEFDAWLVKNGGTTFGFVPRTFAASVAAEAGLQVQGFDGIMLVYALYMSIKVADGCWETTPETWKRCPTFIHDTWRRQ